MLHVSKASLIGDMGSLGRAANKLIRQFRFPWEYEDAELLIMADHDRMMMWNFGHCTKTCKQHMGTGELGLASWARQAPDTKVISLLKDLFRVDVEHPSIKWTGYRITGTVNRSSGYPVYSLWLFAKRRGSKTRVYSSELAPNVHGLAGDRHFPSSTTKW